jgi:hypothetical protein
VDYESDIFLLFKLHRSCISQVEIYSSKYSLLRLGNLFVAEVFFFLRLIFRDGTLGQTTIKFYSYDFYILYKLIEEYGTHSCQIFIR